MSALAIAAGTDPGLVILRHLARVFPAIRGASRIFRLLRAGQDR